MSQTSLNHNATSKTISTLKLRNTLADGRAILGDMVDKYDYLAPAIQRDMFRDLNQILQTYTAKYGLSTLQTANLLLKMTCNLVDIS